MTQALLLWPLRVVLWPPLLAAQAPQLLTAVALTVMGTTTAVMGLMLPWKVRRPPGCGAVWASHAAAMTVGRACAMHSIAHLDLLHMLQGPLMPPLSVQVLTTWMWPPLVLLQLSRHCHRRSSFRQVGGDISSVVCCCVAVSPCRLSSQHTHGSVPPARRPSSRDIVLLSSQRFRW